MDHPNSETATINSIITKLKADMTLAAPGWVFAAATIAVVILLGVAID